jgi:hypothetical protein
MPSSQDYSKVNLSGSPSTSGSSHISTIPSPETKTGNCTNNCPVGPPAGSGCGFLWTNR